MPRYYAAGGGVSKVAVEGVYLTEIEALQCQAPYIAEPIGGSFRCILDCSSECTAHGCIKVLLIFSNYLEYLELKHLSKFF